MFMPLPQPSSDLTPFILVCMSSVLIHSLGECVFLFPRVWMLWSQLHIWGKSPGFIYWAPSLLSRRNTWPCQAPSVQFSSYWEGQQNSEKNEKPIESSSLELIAHQAQAHELFTWNTIIKFSKEHKTLIVSQKCFSCVAWNVYVEPDTSEEEKYPILGTWSAIWCWKH